MEKTIYLENLRNVVGSKLYVVRYDSGHYDRARRVEVSETFLQRFVKEKHITGHKSTRRFASFYFDRNVAL